MDVFLAKSLELRMTVYGCIRSIRAAHFCNGPRVSGYWDPQGHHLGTIVMPEQPANLAWGDNDYRTLYITATTRFIVCGRKLADLFLI